MLRVALGAFNREETSWDKCTLRVSKSAIKFVFVKPCVFFRSIAVLDAVGCIVIHFFFALFHVASLSNNCGCFQNDLEKSDAMWSVTIV